MNSANNKVGLFFLLALLILGSALIFLNKNSPNTTRSSANEPTTEFSESTQSPPERISITAQNDSLDPAVFDLIQHQDYILEINSVDKDYQFILPEFEVADLAPQGQVTEVFLNAKALGTYTYSCGDNCSGEINVGDDDADVVYE